MPEGWKLYLDWRAFIIALADSYFGNCISNSTLNDILEARVGMVFLAPKHKRILSYVNQCKFAKVHTVPWEKLFRKVV